MSKNLWSDYRLQITNDCFLLTMPRSVIRNLQFVITASAVGMYAASDGHVPLYILLLYVETWDKEQNSTAEKCWLHLVV